MLSKLEIFMDITLVDTKLQINQLFPVLVDCIDVSHAKGDFKQAYKSKIQVVAHSTLRNDVAGHD